MLKQILNPVERFLATEAASGIILLIATVIALVIANSPYGFYYQLGLAKIVFGISIQHWINDGLMTIFFFVVGMEIKRELVRGELSSTRKASLPMIAALGGMVVPALIYFFFNRSGEEAKGWGIPMATDIAFAVGVLSFFGKRVPFALKIFLLALAIVDDLGAVLVIALFYTSEITGSALAAAAVALCTVLILQKLGIKSYLMYILLGIIAWDAMHRSGIHATVAGVILGLQTPLDFPLKRGSAENYSPLDELLHALHKWVSFGIMPIFAFANAGVALRGVNLGEVFINPIFHGVSWGLFIGKPLGITLACWLGVKAKLAVLPSRVGWMEILGAGFLGGIGFTMALFISALALDPGLELFSKTGILCGSFAAAIIGGAILAKYANAEIEKR